MLALLEAKLGKNAARITYNACRSTARGPKYDGKFNRARMDKKLFQELIVTSNHTQRRCAMPKPAVVIRMGSASDSNAASLT
jgi:hypothetical protein